MWADEELRGGTRRYRWHEGEHPIRWREFAERLATDEALRSALTEVLGSSPHEAIYWETPPASARTADRPFEMVVRPSSTLARRRPDPDAFAEHLGDEPVAAFANLGGDAWLVAPAARVEPDAYGHLAAFVRRAPAEQIDALWQRVGEQVLRWWSERDRPVWVSTAGDGVAWLHVRLDQRPKYYGHAPYRAVG